MKSMEIKFMRSPVMQLNSEQLLKKPCHAISQLLAVP